jgi:hypothetical protein
MGIGSVAVLGLIVGRIGGVVMGYLHRQGVYVVGKSTA